MTPAQKFVLWIYLFQVVTPFIPGVTILAYAFWLRSKPERFLRRPVAWALALIVLSSIGSFLALDRLQFPDNYLDAWRIIIENEYNPAQLPLEAGIVVTALSFKFAAVPFLAIRIAHSVPGWFVSLGTLFFVGFATYMAVLLNAQPLLNQQSIAVGEVLECIIEIGAFVILVLSFMLIDVAGHYFTTGKPAGRPMQRRELVVIVATSSFLLTAFLGLYILDPWKAALWTVILALVFPIIMALNVVMAQGTPFSPALVADMYISAVRTLTSVVRAVFKR
jgi:hypothetical protein